MGFYTVLEGCGLPTANSVEVAEWNEIETGAAATSTISVGLFGYDVTCIASYCYEVGDVAGESYCSLLIGKYIDGLAFGIQGEITINVPDIPPIPAMPYCFTYHH